MKTTLDLPDDLMRAVKMRAVQENRKLKDTVATLLRRGLAQPSESSGPVVNRVQLPLIRCEHPASPDDLSPERVAAILLEEEAEAHLGLMR